MRQILFATDFSACSEEARRVARDYAWQLGARIHLLHVVWPTADPTPKPQLQALAAEFGSDVPVVTAVESGMPVAERIVDYAERHAIDLIVLGTHGRTGVSRVLIGSVAERVVRTAPCPVLTVPCRLRRGPDEAPAAALPAYHCPVCARPSEDLICEPCRARIRGEALERKRREEQGR
ncbi:MAG TPA: universal stress protein [Methylomirabilota bacterium]|jgi:nucleotide-binding universal stress UspA family protein